MSPEAPLPPHSTSCTPARRYDRHDPPHSAARHDEDAAASARGVAAARRPTPARPAQRLTAALDRVGPAAPAAPVLTRRCRPAAGRHRRQIPSTSSPSNAASRRDGPFPLVKPRAGRPVRAPWSPRPERSSSAALRRRTALHADASPLTHTDSHTPSHTSGLPAPRKEDHERPRQGRGPAHHVGSAGAELGDRVEARQGRVRRHHRRHPGDAGTERPLRVHRQSLGRGGQGTPDPAHRQHVRRDRGVLPRHAPVRGRGGDPPRGGDQRLLVHLRQRHGARARQGDR